MMNIIEEDIAFPVPYRDGVLQLRGRVLRPADSGGAQPELPPVVFNSGFTGGASMYGQLVGKALAEHGYRVMTYDVAGFFKNKDVRNTFRRDGRTITDVDLEDQKIEVLAAVSWTQQRFGRMPVVASWAMGSVASLAAVAELARSGGEQVPFYVPMNYTRIAALQDLRADKAAAHAALMRLADDDGIPPFDTGTEATRLGYYPLDPATQAYVDRQLGGYTDAEGVERWPGCAYVSARSYKEGIGFDPEAGLGAAAGRFPPALIIHGARNTLHMPGESIRLHHAYPGQKQDRPLLIEDMEHGQQMASGHPVFRYMIGQIDQGIRAHCA
ncbi:alpha/beta hydrolase family protein [Bordetella petrii]|uniref:alpha/beta hydrolase family protein n=1 Tax=Bordetella petrii TaxID=94624 RepID=UPI00048B9791|nr:alpha/beta hydrolase [Bordetella petrii]